MLRELGKNVLVGKEAVEKKNMSLNRTIGDIKKYLLNQAENKQEGGKVMQKMAKSFAKAMSFISEKVVKESKAEIEERR